MNINVAALAQITFLDALSFSILGERLCSPLCVTLSLSHIETTKPQQRESLAPNLSGEKKLSGWSARYISYHMYQKIICAGFPFSDK